MASTRFELPGDAIGTASRFLTPAATAGPREAGIPRQRNVTHFMARGARLGSGLLAACRAGLRQAPGHVEQVLTEVPAEGRVRQGQLDRRLQVAELVAAIEAPPREAVRVHAFVGEQPGNAV